MHTATLTVACLALAPLAAQQFTSPSGHLGTEGNTYWERALAWYGSTYYTTYVHVDDTLRGQGARVFRRVSFRRDGELASAPWFKARQTSIAMRIAHADWDGVVSNAIQPDTDYRTEWWYNVVSPRTVSLPAITARPQAQPAPFTIHIPLDVPFYYNGNEAFTLQVRTSPSTLGEDAPYPLDGVQTTFVQEGPQTKFGTGCMIAGRDGAMRHDSLLSNFGNPGVSHWQLVLWYGPAMATTLVMVGTQVVDLPFGGCEHLRVLPSLTFPGSLTSHSGFANTRFEIPHHASFVGARLVSQIAAPDAAQPGLPVALSNAVEVTYPRGPITTLRAASGLSWLGSASWPTQHRLTRGVALVLGIE